MSLNARLTAASTIFLVLVLCLPSMAAGSGWTVTTSASPGATNFLSGVSAASPTDAWAVGYQYDSNDRQLTIAEHWDGTRWSTVPSPNPGSAKTCGDASYAGNMLSAVAAISSTDVWAVGQICTYSNAKTLTEHWDGTAWTVVPSPNEPGLTASTLVAVTAIASNDVWAVGNYEIDSSYEWLTFVEHWNGASWSIVESPNPTGAYESFLNAVAASSATDIWAVGYSVGNNPNTYEVPLIEHYDGSSWTIVTSPFPAPSDYNALYGICVLSDHDAWAVGYANENTHSQNGEALIEHWDGSRWTMVDSPIPGSATLLLSAAAVSSTDIWATGYIQTNNIQFLPVTEHWDGTAWTVVKPPDPGKVAQLFSVATSGGRVFSVGAYSKSAMRFGYMEDPLTLGLIR